MSKKITYIISDIDRWIAFEWIFEQIDKKSIDLSFILINCKNSFFEKYLIRNKAQFRQIDSKSNFNTFGAIYRISQQLNSWNPDIIHTHFLKANIIGLTAGKIVGIKHRIYTRHHSTFHHHYAKKGVFIDRICNSLATKIISISQVVTETLIKEKVNPNKIFLIHHGFDLKKFNLPQKENIDRLKFKYDINSAYPVIGVVSRHIEWKGVQFTISAFNELIKEHPNAVLFLGNARGPFYDHLMAKCKDIPKKNLRIAPFEPDIYALFHLFDVFVHVPITSDIEAFGQIYVEALASGIPSVFTLSGVANEFIIHKENALVVPYQDANSIYSSIEKILNDADLRDKIIKNGEHDVAKNFDLDTMVSKLNSLYNNL